MGLAWYEQYCGSKFHENMKNQVRKMREICDALSGNIYYLSTSGGSGPGFTLRCLEQMRQMDNKSINYSISGVPSFSISGNPLETYNTIAYLGLARYDEINMNMHTFFDSNFF